MDEAVVFGRVTFSLVFSAMPLSGAYCSALRSAFSEMLLGALTTLTVQTAFTPLAAETVTFAVPFFLPVSVPSASTARYFVLEQV